MAIRIVASLAKKLPIPGSEFSSRQASIEISAEVSNIEQVQVEANRLYREAEAAVDTQLGISVPTRATSAPGSSTVAPSRAAPPPAPNPPSRPYPGGRAAAPITQSQIRLIGRLLSQTGGDAQAILHQHQVGSLDQLSCKDASGTGVRSRGTRSTLS